jgi:signal peptidase II
MFSIFSEDLQKRVKLNYVACLIGILVVMLDQWTKYLTYSFVPQMDFYSYLYPYGGIGIFENVLGIDFSINYMTNKGAAWGVLGDYQIPLVFLRISLIFAMSAYLIFFNQNRSWQFPLLLIMAGAIGNVIDFFVYGHVIDMLHFVLWHYDFPIFNLADSAISIGIGLLAFLSWTDS